MAKRPNALRGFNGDSRPFRVSWDIALVEGFKLLKSDPKITRNQLRKKLKQILDDVFEFPPIAEQISDIVISAIVDSVSWRITASKSKWMLVDRRWVNYAKRIVKEHEANKDKSE